MKISRLDKNVYRRRVGFSFESEDGRTLGDLVFPDASRVHGRLFRLSFMFDRMIPGFEADVSFFFLSFHIRKNFPESDAVFEEFDRMAEEYEEEHKEE